MNPIARILCPIDFSEFSRHAFEQAVAIARSQQASLTALYVIAPVQAAYPSIGVAAYVPYVYTAEDLKQFQLALERFVADGGYPVTCTVIEGAVVSAIVGHAAESRADLVVMGTHGRSGFDRMLLGSVTERVLAKAPCPVLTIPPRASDTAAVSRFHRIVCPVDFSPSSLLALDHVRRLAADDARFWVVHVVEREPAFQLVPAMATGAPDDPLVIARVAHERLDNVVRVSRIAGPVDEVVTEGDAADEILRSAAGVRADLIVMGAHAGHSGLLGFGSTTNHVIRAASCPVLTLKA